MVGTAGSMLRLRALFVVATRVLKGHALYRRPVKRRRLRHSLRTVCTRNSAQAFALEVLHLMAKNQGLDVL